VEQRR
jgi:hypothetical protein